MKKLRIGLLGGSFNPAHEWHREISLCALRSLKLDQVWWLVTPQNPLKVKEGMAPYEQRITQAKKLARHPRIFVTDIESKFGTRYTIDTLDKLQKKYKNAQFVWLMGADNLRQIPRWKDWQTIFRLVPVAVFRRPAYAAGRGLGHAAQRFSRFWLPTSQAGSLADHEPPAWMILNNRLSAMSATGLRRQQKH